MNRHIERHMERHVDSTGKRTACFTKIHAANDWFKTHVLESVYTDVYELSTSTKTYELQQSRSSNTSGELTHLSHPLNIPINLKSTNKNINFTRVLKATRKDSQNLSPPQSPSSSSFAVLPHSCNTRWRVGLPWKVFWFCITLAKTNSSPLKIGRNPKGKDCFPTIHFQGPAVSFREGIQFGMVYQVYLEKQI